MEREANAYHQRVRDGYLRLAHRARKRIKIIDGEKPVDALKEEVKKIAGEFLIRKGYKL
jgi:thymidylate kinase